MTTDAELCAAARSILAEWAPGVNDFQVANRLSVAFDAPADSPDVHVVATLRPSCSAGEETSATTEFDDDAVEPVYEWRIFDDGDDLVVRRRTAPGPWETPDYADVFRELVRRLREAGLVAPSEPT